MQVYACRLRFQWNVIKWKHFPHYWPFVLGIHRSPVNSPHQSQWSGALVFSLIWPWINRWVNKLEAGDLRRHRPHYDVILMILIINNNHYAEGFLFIRVRDNEGTNYTRKLFCVVCPKITNDIELGTILRIPVLTSINCKLILVFNIRYNQNKLAWHSYVHQECPIFQWHCHMSCCNDLCVIVPHYEI